jgi:hypothetical protein
MFSPNPTPLSVVAVTVMMVGCALAATFANTAVIGKVIFLIMALVSVLNGIGIADKFLPAHGALNWTLMTFCGLQLIYRGGSDLLDWAGMRDQWYVPARAAWVAGAACLLAYSYTGQPASLLLAAFAWLWILAGTLLSRPSFNPFFALFGSSIGHGVLESAIPGPSALESMRMPVLAMLLLAVGVFMSVNMARAKTNQHQFT